MPHPGGRRERARPWHPPGPLGSPTQLFTSHSNAPGNISRYDGIPAIDSAANTPASTARARQSAAAAPTSVINGVSGDIDAGVVGSGGTSMAPVASANTVSPSSGVWHGRIVRDSPLCAATATRRQPAGLNAASVATTAIVVLSGLNSARRVAYAAIWSAGGAASPNSSI